MFRHVFLAGLLACSTKTIAPQPEARSVLIQSPPVPAADPREVKLCKVITPLLVNRHLLEKPIDDDLSKLAFATYLERLDPGKLFLLASDRERLAKYTDRIDDEMYSGNLELAHDGQQILVERVAVVDKLVAGILAAPMNHDDEELVELDAKKLAPSVTEDELKDRWRQRLELEVMERVAGMEEHLAQISTARSGAAGSGDPTAGIPATPELREAKVRGELSTSYAARFARMKMPGNLDAAADLLNAVTATLDPHTEYMPPADKADFDIAISGSLEGIGAALREHDDLIMVSDLVPGGAATRQGQLAPGDLILSVQQADQAPVDVTDMRLTDVVALVRGPKGTVVRLRVRKPDGHEQTIEITRDVISIEEAYARGAVIQHKTGPAYGYIYLPSFYGGGGNERTASADVRKLLGTLSQRKVAGIVFDLRGNGGGLLKDSVELAGEFIEQGPIVQVRGRDGDVERLEPDHGHLETHVPMVVLVDQFSASASEILAGALQDYHRAVIVGLGPTHGKGTVQAVLDLDRDADKPELGVLKITIQQFFRVNGSSTQLEGVTPDIALPNPSSYIKSTEKDLEHPVEFLSIAPAPHTTWKGAWDLPAMRKHSEERIARNPLLAKVVATTEILAKRRDDTRIPLARRAWDAREKQERDELGPVAPELDKASAKVAVKVIDDPAAAPSGNRLARWADNLTRDPWLDECVWILGEMK